MISEMLTRHIRQVAQFEWRGESIYLRKIGAKDGLDLYARIDALRKQPLSDDVDYQETLAYQVQVISKSLADENGDLLFDSDEGRELLTQINFSELVELGDMAMQHSGFARAAPDEKKSCPTTNVLRTDSPSPSESSTPMPSCLS